MSVSIIMIRGILGELRSRGIAPDRILAECGLSPDAVADIRTMVSSESYQYFVRRALELTRDPGLGLAMGARAPANMLQIVGLLMLTSNTLRDAIATLRHYSPILANGLKWELSECDGKATFSYISSSQHEKTARFTNEYVLATACRIGQHFASSRESLVTEVHFQHDAPSYSARYEALFNCPVDFTCSANEVVFAAHLLDAPQLHADDTFRAMLSDTAERLLRERQGTTTVERARNALQYRRDLSGVNSAILAAAVGLSSRALRRRLGVEGATVTALLHEARFNLACEGLKRSDTSIKELSDRLGFSDPSAFHRAFKRWTGLTPTQFARG